MVKAGMNVMRLNFSHGDYEEHGRRIETLRRVCEELHRPVAILLDTKGPEIRTHDFEGGQTEFKKGQVVRIASQEILGTSDRFSITYANLYQDVKPGRIHPCQRWTDPVISGSCRRYRYCLCLCE